MKNNKLLSFCMLFAFLLCYMFLSDYENIRALPVGPNCWDCYDNGDGLKCWTGYWCGHKFCQTAASSGSTYCIMSGGGQWDCTTPGYCN